MRISDWSSDVCSSDLYPTDEATLERTLSALAPSDGPMCICDPCAGEGVAIAEAAHALGPELASAYAVEFDQERATHARLLVDHCIHGDLMDTMISRQAFGLLWLNPPYGDLARRSEEHTSELQSLMRISYAVFCLQKKRTYCK